MSTNSSTWLSELAALPGVMSTFDRLHLLGSRFALLLFDFSFDRQPPGVYIQSSTSDFTKRATYKNEINRRFNSW